MRFLSGPFYLWFPLLFLNITLAEVKLLVKYPIKLLPPVTGSSFFGNFTNSESDNYYCFGNQDYHPTTYLESLYCLLSLNKLYPSLYSCYSIWGSRSVSITVQGSMEFIQLQQLPRENNLQLLNGTYWLYLNSLDSYYYSHHELDSPVPTAASEVGPTLSVNEEKPTHYSPHFYYNNTLLRHSVHEIKHVDAVPIYLCGRCNNWQKESTTLTKFSLKLRPAFIRARSRAICLRKLIFGALYLFGLSISWLSPLLKAGWAAFFAFSNGLHVFILLVTISIVTLLFTPFILTKKNRSYVRHAYQLFFSTVKATDEIETDYRKAWLLFHAFYFSCVLICVGCTATYVSFVYFGYNRELRNNFLRATFAIAAIAFVYFGSRVSELWSNRVAWIALVWSTIISIRQNINSGSQDEVTVAVLFYSVLWQCIIQRIMSFPRLTRISEMFYGEMTSLQVDLLGRLLPGGNEFSKTKKVLSSHSLKRVSSQSLKLESKASKPSESVKKIPLDLSASLLGPIQVSSLSNSLWIPYVECPTRNLELLHHQLFAFIQCEHWYSTNQEEDLELEDDHTIFALKIRLASVEDIAKVDELCGELSADVVPEGAFPPETEWKGKYLSLFGRNQLKVLDARISRLDPDCSITLLIRARSLNSSSSPQNHANSEGILKDLCLLLLERPALQSATLLQAMLGDSVSSLEIFKSLTASLHIDETCTSRPLGVTYSFHSKCFTQHDVPSTLDMIIKSHRWCSIYRDEHDWRHSLLMDIWSVLRALPCSSPEFIEKTLRIFRCEEINFILDKSSEMNLLVTFLCPQLGENIHLMTSQLSSEENQLLSEYFSQLKPESSTGEFSLESWLNHILYTIAIISYLSYLVRHK